MINAEFQWQRQPAAEAFLMRFYEEYCQENNFIAALQEDLSKHTSSRLFDWVDHIAISYSSNNEQTLQECGFKIDITGANYRLYHHPGAQLPKVVMFDDHASTAAKGLAINVDSIANFLQARGISRWIEGSPLSGFRSCCVALENAVSLWVVERRATRSIEPTYCDAVYLERYLSAQELWRTRPRHLDDETSALDTAITCADEIIDLMGRDLAAWIIMECEREYWQNRNQAALLQKGRQDRLGMGWANHDHHTFRSSRSHFTKLVRLFEMLGFHCRERFWAGAEAGWGAQVMENNNCKLVLFLDVDLESEEISIDFAHQPLPEIAKLGTIGLWCALHGDSILQAGMHHLEAQFLFDNLTTDLQQIGISMMQPFSNFDYLKQAFTHGEIWHVEQQKIDYLLHNGKITSEQADKFKAYGAVGSHLENLQRREGYKGFNQKNVSFIIHETDPRNYSRTTNA